jgi:hypothetical protein
MNYTLYIDESGDFESQRGQWIISGVLFQAKYEDCDTILKQKFLSISEELGLKSIRDFHLTEFRRNFNHEEAVLMARKTLSKLESLPFKYYFLTTVNYSKTSLSSRERTYRLMLSDLLALCENTLDENDKIDNLDLVVATRTIDGILQTNISNIKEDIIGSLPVAFEVDLATKGMVDLIGKHINIRMDYANNSWGLVCADFIANLTYHNRKEKEIQYFYELETKNKYKNFESFGDYESRKANVSYRDGDYVLSVYRWLKIFNKDNKNENAIIMIHKNLQKNFNSKGTTGSYIAFEALIERLWRNHNQPSQYVEISSILKNFENQLESFFESTMIRDYEVYLFRLRNLMIIVENHLGNTKDGFELVNNQHKVISKLATNPEYFDLILNFKSIEIELYINSLEFKKALELALAYSNTINTFKEVWGLMAEEGNDDFEKSRASIKAKMIQFRVELLNNNLDLKIDNLEDKLTNKSDISRFENYKIMLLLKQNHPKKAVEHYFKLLELDNNLVFNSFDLFWFLKAINELFIMKLEFNKLKIKNTIQNQLVNFDLNTVGHPIDLILRELALFEFNLGDKSQALKYIRKSKNAFNLENSNIAILLNIILEIYEDYFKGKLKDESEYFDKLIDTEFYKIFVMDKSTDLLKRVRHYSPY